MWYMVKATEMQKGLHMRHLDIASHYILYACHHNLLLIINRSWILTIHKDRIFPKHLLENKEMDFKNGVKNIQTTGYTGARTVHKLRGEVSLVEQDTFEYVSVAYFQLIIKL